MSENHDHLDLPSVNDTNQRKPVRGRNSEKIENDYNMFYKTQIKKLDSFASEFKKKEIPNYNQELVFKLKTTRPVSDNQFRDELRKAGCDTLISKSGTNAEWIISTKDPSFRKLKEKIKKRINSKNATFVDNIKTFENITEDDQIGPSLQKNPLTKIEVGRIVVSLTKKEDDEVKLNAAIAKIIEITDEHMFKTYDKLITENICLILIDANQNSLKEVMKIDLVTTVDRPPKFNLGTIINTNHNQIDNISNPPENSHGILVVDSGVIRHPLLANAIDQNGFFGLRDRKNDDDRSHGTMVAGIALYGDIEKSIHVKQFNAELWIYSAKLFYEKNGKVLPPDDDELIESKLKKYIEKVINKFPNCKVINLSIGCEDNVMSSGDERFDLAVLIDDLSVLHKDLIFVIAIGNIPPEIYQQNQYPNYLISEIDCTNIIDPSSSIYAISVGALQHTGSELDQPSNITRTGPGLNGMIKPELVDMGGGFDEEILVLNPKYREKWFTLSKGTSFSAPKIANQFGRLFNVNPDSSRNLIKALLLSSAKIPFTRPNIFPKLNSSISSCDFSKISNVYGYGKPNFDEAKNSGDNRVLLKHDGKIKLDHVRYFIIKLPQEFIDDENDREISVTLVFDPPVRKTRAEYLGVKMEYHLFRNVSLENVQEKYNLLEPEKENSDDEKIPLELRKYEIKLTPGITVRKKSAHQKSWVKMTKRSQINLKFPLVLAVVSQKRWNMRDDDMKIPFAVVVCIRHYGHIDLYNKLRALNRIELKFEERVRV